MGWSYHNKPPLGWPIDEDHPLADFLAFWPMQEGSGNKIFDLSRNGHHGTFTGSPVWEPGKFGPCLFFSGIGMHYIPIGTSTQFKILGDLSVSFWVKVKTFPGAAESSVLVCIEGGAGETEAENSILYVFFNTSSNDITYIHEYGSGSNELYLFTNSNLVAKEWTHIALVRDTGAKTVKLYKNGVLVSGTFSYTNQPTNSSSSLPLIIGARTGGAEDDTDARLDQIILYDRALSASEVGLLYREPFCMFQREMIELWPIGAPTAYPAIMTTNTGFWGATF